MWCRTWGIQSVWRSRTAGAEVQPESPGDELAILLAMFWWKLTGNRTIHKGCDTRSRWPQIAGATMGPPWATWGSEAARMLTALLPSPNLELRSPPRSGRNSSRLLAFFHWRKCGYLVVEFTKQSQIIVFHLLDLRCLELFRVKRVPVYSGNFNMR